VGLSPSGKILLNFFSQKFLTNMTCILFVGRELFLRCIILSTYVAAQSDVQKERISLHCSSFLLDTIFRSTFAFQLLLVACVSHALDSCDDSDLGDYVVDPMPRNNIYSHSNCDDDSASENGDLGELVVVPLPRNRTFDDDIDCDSDSEDLGEFVLDPLPQNFERT